MSEAKDAAYVGAAIKRALSLGPPGETWGPSFTPYCSHWDCRLDRVSEMAKIADVVGFRRPAMGNRLLQEASDLLHAYVARVLCSHKPRPGLNGSPSIAPLPPRREAA